MDVLSSGKIGRFPGENATFFRHFLAHFPYILAHELRNPAKKSDGKWKKSSSRDTSSYDGGSSELLMIQELAHLGSFR
jgi:hypothetical protein